MLSLFRWLFPSGNTPKDTRHRRSFKAAAQDRLTGAWTSTATPANYDIRRDYKVLMARVRDLVKNNDYVKRYLSMGRTNVIGPDGIKLQSRVLSSKPDVDFDKPAQNAIEASWKEWGRLGVPDTTGRHTWVSLQNHFISGILSEGEVLYRKIPGWQRNDFRFAIQVLDPMDLPTEYNAPYKNNTVVMGVELDEWESPVAYHFRKRVAGLDTYSFGGMNLTRIPADQIIHRFLPDLVNQTRGVSPMTAAMMRLKMLDGYEEATVIAARVAASMMVFFTREEAGPGVSGDSTADDGSMTMGVAPGEARELPPGVKPEFFDPSHPGEQYLPFLKGALRGVASGLGISYNALANDLEGVNFSSIRTGVLEDREVWKCFQRFTVDAFYRPIFEAFIDNAILADAITINGSVLASGPDRYKSAAYQGRRWSWVDPFKDAKTAQVLISERLASRGMLIRDMGHDPEDVWAELAEEETKLIELGIPPISIEVKDNENEQIDNS